MQIYSDKIKIEVVYMQYDAYRRTNIKARTLDKTIQEFAKLRGSLVPSALRWWVGIGNNGTGISREGNSRPKHNIAQLIRTHTTIHCHSITTRKCKHLMNISPRLSANFGSSDGCLIY